jgi:hypothetical protein
MMHSPDPAAVPTVKAIATIYARVAEYVTKDFNLRRNGDFQSFQSIVFGFCPVEKKLKCFLLTPQVNPTTFSVEIQEHLPGPGDVLAIGAGAAEFDRRLDIKNALGQNRRILDVFREVIEQGRVPTVGGHPQFAVASENGVELNPILVQDENNPDVVTAKINGFNLADINGVEGFQFGLKALGIETDRVLARKALRAKGIDPDSGAISKEVQNTASIEAALRSANHSGHQLGIHDSFSLAAPQPQQGHWYYGRLCSCCGQFAPFCEDPSSGKLGAVFLEEGVINYLCWNCNRPVVARCLEIRAIVWALNVGATITGSKPTIGIDAGPSLPAQVDRQRASNASRKNTSKRKPQSSKRRKGRRSRS